MAITVAVFFLYLDMDRSRTMLQQWAQENGYDILSSTYSWFGGPFWWRRSKGQWVYEISVRYYDGTYRHGYALCGDWLLGLWINKVAVEWS